MKKNLLFILLLFFFSPIAAQRSATEVAVRNLFENQGQIFWFRYYKGRIDDLNDVAVSLAYDGKTCKGYLIYLRSKERFQLQGTLTDENHLKLKEVDKDGTVSGYFDGTIAGARLDAEWNNYDNSIGGKVKLVQVQNEPRIPSYCGDDKWIRRYEGVLQQQGFTMVLQKTHNEVINGMMYSNTGSFQIKGDLNEYLQVNLLIKDASQKILGTLKGDLNNNFGIRAQFVNSKGEASGAPFELVDQLDVGCIEYADYISSYDITYPKTKHNAFNQWMDQQAMNWVATCRDRVKKIKTSNPVKRPNMRATERAFSWTDITYWNKDLISGFINFSDTWSPADRTGMINFDLKNRKALATEDVFKGRYDKFIRKKIKKAYQSNRNFSDVDFRKWIVKEGFTLFTIRAEGIYFSTAFHMIYGQQHVLIPFKDLKPYLKKGTVVWDMGNE